MEAISYSKSFTVVRMMAIRPDGSIEILISNNGAKFADAREMIKNAQEFPEKYQDRERPCYAEWYDVVMPSVHTSEMQPHLIASYGEIPNAPVMTSTVM